MKTIYELNRSFWDFAFDNPEKIKPNHCAVYYFALEHCNRLGWKDKFGFTTSMVMEATGIKSYSVYKKAFDELVEFGFIHVIEYSRNQHSSNVIALKENNKAHSKATVKALDKALDKALSKHSSEHNEKHLSNQLEYNNTIIQDTNLPITNLQVDSSVEVSKTSPPKQTKKTIEERKRIFYDKVAEFRNEYSKEMLRDFFDYWTEHGDDDHKMRFEKQKTFGISLRLKKWNKNDKNFNNGKSNNNLSANEKHELAKAGLAQRDEKRFNMFSE